MTIFIYGPPGSGKSTIGRLLAQKINCDFVDLDEEIEKIEGIPVSKIFKNEGEQYFRDLETSVLNDLQMKKPGVVSLGGGTLLRQENRVLAEKMGNIVCLSMTIDNLIARLKDTAETRPLIAENFEGNLRALMSDRLHHYQSFSMKIDASSNNPEDIAREIQKKTGKYFVKGMGDGYRVQVENGCLSRIGETIQSLNCNGPIALVSDQNVGAIYGKSVAKNLENAGYSVLRLDIPPGESHKNITTVIQIWEKFLSFKLERKSTVIALGGGVVGDMTGFAASSYLRGVPWVNIPTSLLAMIDAGIGGKTGVDLPQGKNLVGAFHAPKMVLIDPDTLSTLPLPHLRNGMAEVIKHGIIGDEGLFRFCNNHIDEIQNNLDEIVRRAVAVKINIIESDPYEKGLRQVLNLGHTIGHAIEKASGYQLLHGEAIGVGTLIEARIAEKMEIAEKGVSDQIFEVLNKMGLPTQVPEDINRDEVIQALWVDKKMENGKIRFPLPIRIGECRVGIEIDDVEQYL